MYDSAAGRLLGVLVNPQAAFQAIVRRPGWWIGLLPVTGFSQNGLMPARRALGTAVAVWAALTVARVVVSFFGWWCRKEDPW